MGNTFSNDNVALAVIDNIEIDKKSILLASSDMAWNSKVFPESTFRSVIHKEVRFKIRSKIVPIVPDLAHNAQVVKFRCRSVIGISLCKISYTPLYIQISTQLSTCTINILCYSLSSYAMICKLTFSYDEEFSCFRGVCLFVVVRIHPGSLVAASLEYFPAL